MSNIVKSRLKFSRRIKNTETGDIESADKDDEDVFIDEDDNDNEDPLLLSNSSTV